MAACSHQQGWGCNSNIEKKQPKAKTKGLLEVKEKGGGVGGGEMPSTEHKEQTLNTLLLDPFQLRGAPGLCRILGSHVLILPASSFSKSHQKAKWYTLNLFKNKSNWKPTNATQPTNR